MYEEEKEFNVLKGQIPDFGYDIKMLSVVVDGEKSKTIPTRGLYKTQIDCSNGTRGEWDYNAWNLTLENVSENARCNITFTSNLSEEEYNKYLEAGKSLRRNTYRGKDITSYHTDGSLYEMISSGRFDDIYVGDYIVANNITWLVADIDNYLSTGDIQLTKHHLTMIPQSNLIADVMNDTDTTEGAYYNSKMKQTILPNVLNTYVKPAFGTHVLTYNTALTTETNKDVSNNMANTNGVYLGASSKYAWYESQIDLMSEINVYGSLVVSSSTFDVGVDYMQYAIFQLRPNLIVSNGKTNIGYWLKAVANNTCFTLVNSQGVAGFAGAHYENGFGVRPRFLIG